jgi:hypothetical protein
MIYDIWNVLKDLLPENTPYWLIATLLILCVLSYFILKRAKTLFDKNDGVIFGCLIPIGKISFHNAACFLSHKNPLKLKSKSPSKIPYEYKLALLSNGLEFHGKDATSLWEKKITDAGEYWLSEEENNLNSLFDLKDNLIYKEIQVKRRHLLCYVLKLNKQSKL